MFLQKKSMTGKSSKISEAMTCRSKQENIEARDLHGHIFGQARTRLS